jgi:hypothetical protein
MISKKEKDIIRGQMSQQQQNAPQVPGLQGRTNITNKSASRQ